MSEYTPEPELKIKFYQQADDMQPRHMEPQELEISTEDAGAGQYYVLKTKRWAIESIDEIAKIIDKFKKAQEAVKNE